MFLNEELQTYLETSPTIKSQGSVVAEWNMNQMDNIYRIGNYRYRPTSSNPADLKFTIIASSFDDRDTAGFYTGATDADVLVDGGYEDGGVPATAFKTVKEKEQMLYSLEDCFGRFRPRSGINKIRYFDDRFLHFDTPDMAQRPRYYMSDSTDTFKYWTSYRTENGIERGISKSSLNIDDAAPFVVYEKPVPANRVVVKTQTHVGSLNLGSIIGPSGLPTPDPFFGEGNKVAPAKWKIQYLDELNNWVDAIRFNATDVRRDNTPIIGADGYLEISYGLNVPDQYKDIFAFAGEVLNTESRPDSSINGYSYLHKTSPKDTGTFYIWLDEIDGYQSFVPKYEWHLADNEMNNTTNFVRELVNAPQFGGEQSLAIQYTEFMYINGLRIVVDTLTKDNSTFDLIEMSPRLVADLSDRVTEYSVTKQASDIGNGGLPVGQLLAGTGSLSIFDYDDSFNANNENSIIQNYLAKNLQIKFYDKIVNLNGYNYFVPLKAMYSETFPESSPETKQVTISLRDMFLYFESLVAPQVLLRDTTLSYAISLLLDSVGFSNYVFKRNLNEPDPVIPFFFIPPDTSIADILNGLAISTQSAMFFDEYNNFVVMSKGFMLPSIAERSTDLILRGSSDFYDSGVLKNRQGQEVNSAHVNSTKLANIIKISSQNDEVYNDGKIVYTTRYVEKQPSVDTFYSKSDKNKVWVQTPSLLWQISGDQMIAAQNSDSEDAEMYSLAAVTLNSDLPAVAPSVQNNEVVNNIIDLGESAQLLVRGTGYLYANGEVIKYDAMQYAVATSSGTQQLRWISNSEEYQDALAKMLPGSKIYQTGLVRIFSEPYYEQIENTELFRPQNGNVIKHGRGQFGTSIVAHSAGLDPYWTDNGNNSAIPEANRSLRICNMSSKYLFGSSSIGKPPTTFGKAGIVSLASRVSLPARTGIIKNYFSENKLLESEINSYQSAYSKDGKRVDGVVQSSAFIFQGPTFATTEDPLDYTSYVYKKINKDMTHFGTRLRIIGKKQDAENLEQYATGGTTYYNTSNADPNKNVGVSGGSGGLGILLDPSTNNGYYLELIALSNSSSSDSKAATDENQEVFHDVVFYKIQKQAGATDTDKAVPVKLWSGLSNILINYGDFVGQGRVYAEKYPTVYDVAVEYKKVGSRLKFYLYINGKMLTIVEDEDPIKNADGQIITNNTMAMFVRGSARLMFENVYAIGNNYASNTGYAIASTDSTDLAVFGDKSISIQEALRKYAISGVIQSAHLSGISATEPPRYNIYYDEFGTILREAAYFNVRYDKAYPALSAQMYDSRRSMKGYTVSGFIANAYSAEFMLFNHTDQTLVFRENTDNYPFIYGVTFTQQSTKELTLDDFFNKLSGQNNTPLSNLSYPNSRQSLFSPQAIKEKYYDIKASRSFYGKKDFSLEASYIQSNDQAQNLMSWIISKIMKPRKSIGISLFNMPTLQLGDIVQINYKDKSGVDAVASEDSRFVVYNIQHTRSSSGPEMTVYLSEVV
jgi:hypothetical protein